ncbi:hypothetical protein QQY66_34630 [Streptomyces sp. DG2A-72]|uniref:hypothetical protein n=1 Tax=Streptomyces sp. DG2A-72 TaxID=3051386 RepID=UPI00265C4613|nr:hypothetical protein [Streptomyces sp. DG2A-72]MDO0936598.1 hypothetical protein [Streptomyces sp. DG2A-72]
MNRFPLDEPVHRDVALTFRRDSSGFVSRSDGGLLSCPPYIIARCAARRVPPESLKLPDGYDQEALDQIMAITGFVDRDVRVTSRQAEELAQIGAQLLEMQAHGKVQPPLDHFEHQSVAHLVRIVSASRK